MISEWRYRWKWGALMAVMLFLGILGARQLYWLATQKQQPVPLNKSVSESPYDMVLLNDYIPGLYIDLRYAGSSNVLGRPLYSNANAILRRGTADKLKRAESEFELKGYHLKIWDAYRTPEAQRMLWSFNPDERYLVNPGKGLSHHCRGAAVDATLVDNQGWELIMPSDFDDFTARANRVYDDVEPQAGRNAELLKAVMEANGFTSIYNEWWHFADRQAESYPVEEKP